MYTINFFYIKTLSYMQDNFCLRKIRNKKKTFFKS